jgi:hypothetical protein
MLVECLIQREGFTSVTVQRSRYDFKRNEAGHQVCDILSAGHSSYLLDLPDFRLYSPPVVATVYTCEKCGKQFDHHLGLSGHKRSKECRDESTPSSRDNKKPTE